MIALKGASRLKVTARGVGLALTVPQGAVGVRLTTGTLRNCAIFEPPTVRKDQPGRFVALGAAVSPLADCSSVIRGRPPRRPAAPRRRSRSSPPAGT